MDIKTQFQEGFLKGDWREDVAIQGNKEVRIVARKTMSNLLNILSLVN